MGSKLAVLTQASFWIVTLKMPAYYLVTFTKLTRFGELLGMK